MSRLFETEAFVQVVEKGSFTAAAKSLGITKSYASRLVSKLEDRLGVRLLNRSTRKLSLTEPGQAYFERCAELMQSLQAAEDAATELNAEPRGRLRLTLPSAFGLDFLVCPLAQFKLRYPRLTLEAIFTDRRVDILAEGFDLAIRAGELEDSMLVARKLVSAHRRLYASRAYLERHGRPSQPEQLVDHECLLYAYHNVPGQWRLQGPEDRTVDLTVTGSFVANHGRMLIEAAASGLGVAYLPEFLAAADLRSNRIERVLPKWQFQTSVYAVFPHTRHLSTKVRLFVDHLIEAFQQPPWSD